MAIGFDFSLMNRFAHSAGPCNVIVVEQGRGQDASLAGFRGSLGRPIRSLWEALWSAPGASWERLEGSLGPHEASWESLGASRGLLGTSWGLFGASLRPLGGIFGASWGLSGLFGGLLGPLGAIMGASRGPLRCLLACLRAILGASRAVFDAIGEYARYIRHSQSYSQSFVY